MNARNIKSTFTVYCRSRVPSESEYYTPPHPFTMTWRPIKKKLQLVQQLRFNKKANFISTQVMDFSVAFDGIRVVCNKEMTTVSSVSGERLSVQSKIDH